MVPTKGYFRRPCWAKGLVIYYGNENYHYNNGNTVGATLEDNDDFVQCDINGNEIKGKVMTNFKEANVVVLTSNANISWFETEEDAYEYIQDVLEEYPKVQFKLFKLYQEVKPKRIDISSLISNVTWPKA